MQLHQVTFNYYLKKQVAKCTIISHTKIVVIATELSYF